MTIEALQPTDRVKKYRRASMFCWWVGTAMTIAQFYQWFGAALPDPTLVFVASAVVGGILQYILTLGETPLFNGTIPPLWKIQWKEGGPVVFIAAMSVACILFDFVLNLSGVWFIMSQLNKDDLVFGASDYIIRAVQVVFTIVFSIFFAVGSEMFDELANFTLRSNYQPQPTVQHQRPMSNREKRIAARQVQARNGHQPQSQEELAALLQQEPNNHE